MTRGKGRLEGFLARHRARMANRLIPEELRGGRLVDIGCGSYPLFLTTTRFTERYGLDRLTAESGARVDGITLVHHDLGSKTALPFDSGSIEAVTMLAVFEHLEHDVLQYTLLEIRRVLRPGGIYILTTPAAWTDRLLRVLARVGLVSAEEIEEHQDAYTHERIAALLEEAGFERESMRFGTFEFSMNLWATARR
ncbi:MAG TPA: methyltransferase domain-containing protein [Longimicrobiales bacterium]